MHHMQQRNFETLAKTKIAMTHPTPLKNIPAQITIQQGCSPPTSPPASEVLTQGYRMTS
ncbi:hypothetical protein DL98DRAFT_99577 [Cadophora sp. DSE1049]|nr:hypothetical protein DL98DRAFT_99577 [Cadophora sp. DSE1049]